MFDDAGDGAPRRKSVRRTDEERAAIVAQSYEAGQTVSGVAQRHGIAPSQLSTWRSAARAKASRPGGTSQFAEVAVVPDPVVPSVPHDGIEIVAGSVVVRLPKSTTASRIVDIARRLARQG
jgi:transposase